MRGLRIGLGAKLDGVPVLGLPPLEDQRVARFRSAGAYVAGITVRLAATALLLALCGCYRVPARVPRVTGKLRTQYTMRVIEIAPGLGKLAEPGKMLVVHYTGYLRDGTKFDSSRDRDKPFEFEQGKRRVIPGFDNGCEGLRVGGKRRLLMPYQIAYGEKGRSPRIPPKAELIFDIELLDVKEPPAEPAKP